MNLNSSLFDLNNDVFNTSVILKNLLKEALCQGNSIVFNDH